MRPTRAQHKSLCWQRPNETPHIPVLAKTSRKNPVVRLQRSSAKRLSRFFPAVPSPRSVRRGSQPKEHNRWKNLSMLGARCRFSPRAHRFIRNILAFTHIEGQETIGISGRASRHHLRFGRSGDAGLVRVGYHLQRKICERSRARAGFRRA